MSGRPSARTILYVTVDGVLQQLGYSQVGRVVLGLAHQGFRYRLLSLESGADLSQRSKVMELDRRFAAAGIPWSRLPYDSSGTPIAAASNLARLANAVRTLVARHDVGLVHARAYHAATIARAAKRVLGVPYLFDARGRWIDERLLGGRWFTNPMVERGARAVERGLYQGAAGLVTLTQLHADDILSGAFGNYRGAPVRVITTCADFSAFKLESRTQPLEEDNHLPSEVRRRLAGKLVVAFVGSTNAFYRHDESFQLALRILARRADAHLLILTVQQREFLQLARRHNLDEDRLTVATAAHEEMPHWLARIDWAIQLLNEGVAKRGSMPTKLAEFFASGVRPLHFGCNQEVSEWVERAGSGLVLGGLAPAELDAAADFVATASAEPALLANARQKAQPHFDLASGLQSYQLLLGELGYTPARN